MKHAVLAAILLSLIGALAAVPAAADTILYNNTGPAADGAAPGIEPGGIYGSWLINPGNAVSDSFTVTSKATVTGVIFDVWLSPGDSLGSVTVSIAPAGFNGGPGVSAGGYAAYPSPVPASDPVIYGEDIYVATVYFDYSVLPGITYWLTLDYAETASRDAVGWDISNGPSVAYAGIFQNLNDHLGVGTDSNTFEIMGNIAPGVVPEPSNILLLATGIAGLGGTIRRKYTKYPGPHTTAWLVRFLILKRRRVVRFRGGQT